MQDRIRPLNTKPLRNEAEYVLHWTQMNRRVHGNHALAYAAELANERGLALLVYEGLTCTYPHANDRVARVHSGRRAGYGDGTGDSMDWA